MNEVSFQRSSAEIVRIWSTRTLLSGRSMVRVMIIAASAVFLFYFDGFYRYLGAAALLYLLVLPVRTIVTFWRVVDHPRFTGPTTLGFDENGLTVTAGDGTVSQMPWQAFGTRAQNTNYYFLRHAGTHLDMIIPKRAFTPEQAAAFERCLVQIGGTDQPRSRQSF